MFAAFVALAALTLCYPPASPGSGARWAPLPSPGSGARWAPPSSPGGEAYRPPAARAHRRDRIVRRHAQGPSAREPALVDPGALYSVHARRLVATYLKLRLLELRELHLQRAADAVARRLSVSALLRGP